MEGSGGGVKAAARFSRVMEAAAAGEDGEEPLRSARVLGSELVETYTVRAAAVVPCRFLRKSRDLGRRWRSAVLLRGEDGGERRAAAFAVGKELGFWCLTSIFRRVAS